MADSSGSRWYFPVFEGLYDAKHVKQMGMAIWLYGWVLARAWIHQQEGMLTYNHEEAAEDLGVTSRTIKSWFQTLQQNQYVIKMGRKPHHLEVQVSNWRSVEEWLTQRQDERSAISFTSHAQNGERSEERSEESCTLSITIKLLSYKYPMSTSGAGQPAQPPNLADAFRFLLDVLRTAPNKQAILAEIYLICFPPPAPDYGYLGKVARSVGGAGRLAEILWQLSAKPPTGDVLAYITKAFAEHRNNGRVSGKSSTEMLDDWYEQEKRKEAAHGAR